MSSGHTECAPLGARIRKAREALSWTQTKLAEAAGFASFQIVSVIEKGQREVKAWELSKIAAALHVSVDTLLRGEAIQSATVQWRDKIGENSKELEARFLERCGRYRLLEQWCQAKPPKQLHNLQLNPCPSFEDVQAEADKMRLFMELGGRPSLSLSKALEEDYGVKIFHDDLEEQGSALSARGDFGMAILLNATDSPWRRNFSLAHELFHLLSPPEIAGLGSERVEQLADVFASQLLLPAGSIQEFLTSRVNEGKITYGCLIQGARGFSVSSEALLWRLVNMKKITKEQVEGALSNATFRSLDRASFQPSDPPPRLPERYVRLCMVAYNRGKLGLGRVADFLETSLVDLAGVVSMDGELTDESVETQLSIA
jgi:Zn-dependent peptidase ImmA (M78 family)/transcriptional regulator with XRE-family HTH domain